MNIRLLLVLAVAALSTAVARAESTVLFPSLDSSQAAPVMLKAYWYAVPAPQAPAVVLFHGCGGLYDRKGRVSERMQGYAELINQQGMHVLMVDSLTPRGEKEICTQRTGTRRITMTNRRKDALAALQWLAQRSDVDAQRIGLLGWSNGGSTVLSATNRRHAEVAAFNVAPAFAVAFYPGCEADLRRGYEPTAPLLMLVGEADDWTPAAPCHELARRSVRPQAVIVGYAGAYHGFDSAAPVRLRQDVPNGVNPGQGVHVGGNPEALRRSRERLIEFLKAVR